MLTGNENEFVSLIDQIRGQAQEGSDIVTTLDAGAQQLATDLLAPAGEPGRRRRDRAADRRGPGDGVARPGYDPNTIPTDSRAAEQGATRRRSSTATIQATYPPGSTMKVVTAAAALDSGEFTPETTARRRLAAGVQRGRARQRRRRAVRRHRHATTR